MLQNTLGRFHASYPDCGFVSVAPAQTRDDGPAAVYPLGRDRYEITKDKCEGRISEGFLTHRMAFKRRTMLRREESCSLSKDLEQQ